MNGVVYFSRRGNTRKLANAIAKGAGTSAVPMEQFNPSEAAGILFIGASIYGGTIDDRLRAFLSALTPAQVKRAVIFGTSAGKKTALPEIKAILEPSGIPVDEHAFHCKGSLLFINCGRPNGEDLRRAEAFAERICGGRT